MTRAPARAQNRIKGFFCRSEPRVMALTLANPHRIKPKRHRRRKIASGRRDYNYFRDYEPGTDRYIEPDPIGLRGGVSLYGYALADPFGQTDRAGLATWTCRPDSVKGMPVGLGDRDYKGDKGVKFCKYSCRNSCYGSVGITNSPGQKLSDGWQCWGAILRDTPTSMGMVYTATGVENFTVDTSGFWGIVDYIRYPIELTSELKKHEVKKKCETCNENE